MFGLKPVGTLADANQVQAGTTRFKVADGVTITKGDAVYFASGYLTNASVAGKKLAGVAAETVVGNAIRKCHVITNPTMLYLVDNDNDGTTFAQSHVGTYFDLIGGTGAMQVDTSSTTTTGQLVCLEYNPQISGYEGDTSIGLFMIAESAYFGRAA
jgi:hypothetical protein